MTSLKNTIVLISGASSGIGAACARAFAAEGAHLILAARRGERIRAAADQLHAKFGIETLPLTLDVRDQAAVARVLGSLPERWDPIDILLNNAGLSRGLDKLHEGLISALRAAALARPPDQREPYLVSAGRELAKLLALDLSRLDGILRGVR